MNERMELANENGADFFISLHTNSAGYTSDMIKANGLETYYFESTSMLLARTLATKITAATGRTDRGAKQSNYRVTMNSFMPSVLVELGFMPNPRDFDSLCNKEDIYETVTAIGNSILSVLQ